MRVAVVGGGVSGLAAAHELLVTGGGGVRVTLYEEDDHLGGHARTVAVSDGAGCVVNLDLGFMTFNQVTYPHMVESLEGLGVEMERSDMSFSVSAQPDGGGRGCEWGNANGVSSILAQKTNILKPSFWRMVCEMLKFKKDALAYLEDHAHNPDLDHNETLGQFIQSHGYSLLFQEAYLIPVCAGSWSCPSQGVLGLSAFFVLSFLRNHDLLQLFRDTQLPTFKACSQSYVNKVKGELESMGCRVKTSCRVKSVSSFDGAAAGYRVLENDGSEETYDSVILGVHAPNALKVLGAEATHDELTILGACQYVHRDIYLHCDQNLMPRNPSAWSAWNFLGTTTRGFGVTYWLNHIQKIESVRPFLVTINPPSVPDHVLLKWSTSLPVPSVGAAKACLQFDQIQGKRGIWFSGAYQGHGFHEDGMKSGKAAAQGLLGKKCDLMLNPKQKIPSWTEAGTRLLTARFFNRYISIGNLILVEDGGSVLSFGKAGDKCRVKSVVRVHDPLFYWKLATQGNIGLGEAYINGCFSLIDKRQGLLNLILIMIANRDARRNQRIPRKGAKCLHLIARLAYAKYQLREASRKNTATQTRRNISQHYDLSNDFFSLFLDKSMTYSCAVFKMENESLEAAQQRKLSLLITKAKVEKGHHVLDIGSGWGSLAIQVVKQTGCKYTGVTLSEEQLKYAEKKVREAGLEERITFLLCDYRKIPPCKYDAIISCGMIEHVGHEYMEDFFSCCESYLAEDGILVLQFISIPEERYEQYRTRPDFIKEYIFPGGCLPSLARVTSAMSTSSRFCIEHVENIGPHYYTTLMHWRDNFIANKDEVLAMGFDENFIRLWEYYLIFSAAGFKSRAMGDYQVVFSRPSNRRLGLA